MLSIHQIRSRCERIQYGANFKLRHYPRINGDEVRLGNGRQIDKLNLHQTSMGISMAASSPSSGTNASAQLADFCASLRFEDIPTDVIAHIKLSILDGLGCCLVGSTLPWTRKVRDMIDAEGAAPVASLLGSSKKCP